MSPANPTNPNENETSATSPTRGWAQARQLSEEMNSETFLADLEARYVAVREERDDLSAKLESQTKICRDVQNEVMELRTSLQKSQDALANAKQEALVGVEKSRTVEVENRAKEERLDRMAAESDALREEISRLSTSNVELKATISDMETKVKLNESEAVPLKFQVDRLQKEVGNLDNHLKWTQKELDVREEQLMSSKTAHSQELVALRSKLEQTSTEKDTALSELVSLRHEQRESEAKAEKLAKELQNVRKEAADASLAAEQELLAERRVMALLKEQKERIEARHDEVVRQMEVLQDQARQAEEATQREQDTIRVEMEEKAKRILQEQADDHQRHVRALQEQLADSQRQQRVAEDGLLALPAGASPCRPPSTPPTNIAEGEPLSLTDLYTRLTQTQDELRAERAKRRRTELRMERIQADIEAKAPLLTRQRQEHDLVIQRAKEFKQRWDDALEELKSSQAEASDLRLEAARIHAHNRELESESKELAKQVQTLLVSRAGGELSAMSEIPKSVEEMQSQNQRLLNEHRRLTEKVQELQTKLRSDELSNKLKQAERDLEKLREDRKQQEVHVREIVMQRDLYRALTERKNSGFGRSEEGSPVQIAMEHSERARMLEQKAKELEGELATARQEMHNAARDKQAVDDRLARYNVHVMDLTKSVDKLQLELSSAKADMARASADSAYHRERSQQLEASLQRLREEMVKVTHAKNEMQRINAGLQQSLSVANGERASAERQLQGAETKLRLAETQAQNARDAESRLAQEAKELRTELASQAGLLQSVHRIEATLSAKNDEEVERLKEECVRFSKQLTDESEKNTQLLSELRVRLREQELSLQEMEEQKKNALLDAMKSKKEALEASKEIQTLNSRIETAQNQPASRSESITDKGADQIESLKDELEALRSDLKTWKERSESYQKMAQASEGELAKLKTTTEAFKKDQETEVTRIQQKLAQLEHESAAKEHMIAELTNDLTSEKERHENITRELNSKLSVLRKENEAYKKDADAAHARADGMASDIAVSRSDAAAAQKNYERELGLHAEARTALRAAREEAEAAVRLQSVAEEKVKSLEAELVAQQAAFEYEKASSGKHSGILETSLKESRAQNSLLHDQLEKLGETVERLQKERITTAERAVVRDTDTGADNAETGLLRKSVSELRELVRFLRCENVSIQSQLDLALKTAEREKASAGAAKRSLNEARNEIQMLLTSRGSGADDIESRPSGSETSQRLRNAEEQVNLLRDSNKLLREDFEKLQKAHESTVDELRAARESLKPAEKRQHDLETEKSTLVAEKASLTREIEAWKGRAQSLVSKFHQIDPEEHKKVLGQVETLNKECEALKSQNRNTEQETARLRTIAARLNKEVKEQKAVIESHNKTMAQLSAEKESMANAAKDNSIATERDDLKRKVAEIERANAAKDNSIATERDDLKRKVAEIEREAASAKTERDGANERNVRLTARLRQFVKETQDLKSKNAALQTENNLLKEAAATDQTQFPQGSQPSVTKLQHDKAEQKAVSATEIAKLSSGSGQDSAAKGKDDSRSTLPRLPVGGFRFGPSKTSAQPGPPDNGSAPKPPTTGVASDSSTTVPPDEASADQTSKVAPSAADSSSADRESQASSVGGKRRLSRETKELSMKQKLLAKRLKLQALKEKKKAEESADSGPGKKRGREDADEATDLEESKKDVSGSEVFEEQGRKKAREDAKVGASDVQKEVAPTELGDGPDGFSKETSRSDENVTQSAKIAMQEQKMGSAGDGSISGSTLGPPVAASAAKAGEAPAGGTVVGTSDATQATGSIFGGAAQKRAGASGAGQASAASSSQFGSQTTPFGVTGFGRGGGAGYSFGKTSGTVGGALAAGFGVRTAGDQASGGAFLDMKPPGTTSTPPTFSFGSSSSIKLPMPNLKASSTSPFGVFGGSQNPFGAVAPKPLFRTSIPAAQSQGTAEQPEDAAESKAENDEDA